MAPVCNQYDLARDIDKLSLRMPDQYLVVYDSTMARFWFCDAAAREQVARTLQQVPCGHILTEGEQRTLGIWFSDQRYGELIFLFDPGWIVASGDFNSSSWMPLGMHGYHPDDAYSDAICLTSRKPECELHTIADLYRWMESVTGIGPGLAAHSAEKVNVKT